MPLIASEYQAPCWMPGGDLQSAWPHWYCAPPDYGYQRTRIHTLDDDFLDLDVMGQGARRVGIVTHGLEGNSRRWYVRAQVRALLTSGYDAIAWNMRGCSGEPNRKVFYYHGGATYDLETVIQYALNEFVYQEVVLIGFSLGGNVVLRYLGEQAERLDSRIRKGMAYSVPTDFSSGARQMEHWRRYPYMRMFLKSLREKVQYKARVFPDQVPLEGLAAMRTFREFDGRYIAPYFGFTSAEHYWTSVSSRPLLPQIAIPTLLVNALNDPFLAPACFPIPEAEASPHFYLEMPETGGHCGFPVVGKTTETYAETCTIRFLREDSFEV